MKTTSLILVLLVLLLTGCSESEKNPMENTSWQSDSQITNMTALLRFTSSTNYTLKVIFYGPNGSEEKIETSNTYEFNGKTGVLKDFFQNLGTFTVEGNLLTLDLSLLSSSVTVEMHRL